MPVPVPPPLLVMVPPTVLLFPVPGTAGLMLGLGLGIASDKGWKKETEGEKLVRVFHSYFLNMAVLLAGEALREKRGKLGSHEK